MVNRILPSGALVALATPVTADGTLDEAGLDRLVDRVVAGGVVGIAPVGSTGEGPRLTRTQRLAVTRRVVTQAAGLPVISGVPVVAVPDAIEELDQVGRLGARAALVAPPSFFPMTDDEIVRLYTWLADKSPVPLVLYNIPAFSHAPLKVDVVAQLMHHPNIAGIKDSSRDLEYLQSVLTVARSSGDDFAVYTGTDTMLVPSALAGADGAIAASANLVPQMGARILKLLSGLPRRPEDQAPDAGTALERAMELQRELTAVVSACRKGSPPAGWKAALHLAGVCPPYLVPPASHLTDAMLNQMRRDLRATGLVDLDA